MSNIKVISRRQRKQRRNVGDIIVPCILNKPSQRTCALFDKLMPSTTVPMCLYKPNHAARMGFLRVIQYNRTCGFRCSSRGADWASRNGFLDVVRDLRQHDDIHCTPFAIYSAAKKGFLDIIHDLHENNIICEFEGCAIDLAASHGHLHVVYYFRARGSKCSITAAHNAAENGHMHILCDLREHEITATRGGADRAARNGHLAIVRDLREHGEDRCTVLGANNAARNGHLDVVRDIREHDGIECTQQGANYAAMNGHLDVLRDLQAHGIHVTCYGIDWAAMKGHLDVLQYLKQQYHDIRCTHHAATYVRSRHLHHILQCLREHDMMP